jgi:uncharacterized membrane protein
MFATPTREVNSMRNTDDIFTDLQHTQQQMLAYMQLHWRLSLFEGIFFILLGFAAIIIPQFFSVFIVIFLGWLIVIGGVIHVSRALFFPVKPGFGLWLARLSHEYRKTSVRKLPKIELSKYCA